MQAQANAAGVQIDRLMEDASRSLAQGRYADCERKAAEALQHAYHLGDYERMGRILLPLQEARRQRRQQASDVRKVTRIRTYEELEALLTGSTPIKPGCYLVEPPLVGIEGRELRDKALAEDVPVIVVVHEPLTRMGLWPVVAVGPVTVRTRIPPPKRVDVGWMMRACEALGDSALTMVDPTKRAADRVAQLMDLLAAVIDHEKLHQALTEACRAAHAEALLSPRRPARSESRKGRPSAGEFDEDRGDLDE